jgi:sphingomyelin phosphodiesterase acid-like 3
MKAVHKYLFPLIAASFLLALLQDKSYAQGKCLIVSDIHYNPDSTYKLQPGNDSNHELLEQSVKAMQKTLPNPDFIMIAGDFIWHGDRNNGYKLSKETKSAIIKTITDVFQKYFPHVPVVTTLGNNDTYQGDYDIQDGDFLNQFADQWEKGGVKVFNAPFRQKGYYAYTIKDKYPDMEFVVLNTTLLSVVNNSKGYNTKADSMLKWLDNTLMDAKNKGQKVWILSHIPPGKNVYSMLSKNATTDMWGNNYSQTYTNLIVKYAPQIRFSIASHTHFNDFRVFCDAAGKPVSYMRVVPSISPNHYNNPSFEVADFDKDYHVTSETTYYLDLKTLSTTGFVFKSAFGISTSGLSEITPGGILSFINSHSTPQSPVPTGYIQFYNVGAQPVENDTNCCSKTFYEYLSTSVLKGEK